MMGKWTQLVILIAMMLPLGSCTTLATGILASPPGINRNSFRECLLKDGFFTPTALVGAAGDDYVRRHADTAEPAVPYDTLMKMNDGLFIAKTASTIFQGLLSHQQFGGASEGSDSADAKAQQALNSTADWSPTVPVDKSLLDGAADRPYGINIVGKTPYPQAGDAMTSPPLVGDDQTLPENRMNLYLDCYVAPVGVEATGQPAGLLTRNLGDYDVEGRVLRAHVLLAMLAQYGTELVTSHASAKQPAYAAMLLKDITNAEMELRLASPVMNTDRLQAIGLAATGDATATKGASKQGLAPAPSPSPTPTATPAVPTTISYPKDDFAGSQPILRWSEQVTRILRVFQVAQDDEMIDAHQSLDRLTNIIAAFSKPTLGAFQGLLQDSLKGLGAMQKVSLYGDAMLRDGRETLAVHRRITMLSDGRGNSAGADNFTAFQIGQPSVDTATPKQSDIATVRSGWMLWDGQIRQACTVLAAIAKDNSVNCVPADTALQAEFDKRAKALKGS